MGPFVPRIAQRLDDRLIRARKGSLHVVRQRREPHRLCRFWRHAIEPFERLQQMVAVVRVTLDDPGARGVDEGRFHHWARTGEHIESSPFASATANGASLMWQSITCTGIPFLKFFCSDSSRAVSASGQWYGFPAAEITEIPRRGKKTSTGPVDAFSLPAMRRPTSSFSSGVVGR